MHLNETRLWPVWKAVLILAGIAAVLAVLLAVLSLYKGKKAGAYEPSGTGAAHAGTAAAQSALGSAAPGIVQIVRPEGVRALADPFIVGKRILFAAGPSTTALDTLLLVEPVTGACEQLPVQKQFDTLRNPCMDDAYLIYADVAVDGGGVVRALDRATEGWRTICTVAAGVPKLWLDAPYLLVQEHTGEGGVRLNLWDLTTGESAALALFTNSPFGASAAWLNDGFAYYADASGRADGTGVVCTVQLPQGTVDSLDPETPVYDPKANADTVAWLAGNHGENSDLYIKTGDGAVRRIARGAVDFAITETCVVFHRDETVFAYAFADDRIYVLSETGANAQLVTARDSLVLWRDVTNPEKPLWKYVWIG